MRKEAECRKRKAAGERLIALAWYTLLVWAAAWFFGLLLSGGARGGELRDVVVRVRNQQSAHTAALGSGTVIALPGGGPAVLSCAHLFREGQGQLTIYPPAAEPLAARLLALDERQDLSLLAVDGQLPEPVNVAADAARQGDTTWAAGYGQQGQYRIYPGRVLGYASANGMDSLVMTGRAREGDSGGPIFNEQGELAAVLWGTDGNTYGTPAPAIRRLLARVEQTQCENGQCLPRPFAQRQAPASEPPLARVRPPQQAPAPNRSAPPADTPAAGRSCDCQGARCECGPKWAELEKRIAELGPLIGKPGPPGPAGPPGKDVDPSLVERIQARLEEIAGGSAGWKLGSGLAGLLGLAGIPAALVGLAGWLGYRRLQRRIESGKRKAERGTQGGPEVSPDYPFRAAQ